MPTPREKMASCVIGQYIYVVGGAAGENQPGLTTNERYDTASDSWVSRRAMPTGRRELAAGVVDGKCYAIGGRQNFGQSTLAVVEAYDPDTDQWSTKASMPSGKFFHAAAVIDEIIYVVGGVSGFNDISNSLHSYDPSSDSWTELAPMSSARAVLAATAMGGKLYALGGTNNPASHRSMIVEVYTPASDQWSEAAPLPAPLAGLTASAVNGNIYAIGGGGTNAAVADVNVYEPDTDSWNAVEPLAGIRNRHTSAVVGTEIFVIGGARSVAPPHPGITAVESLDAGMVEFVINAGLNDAWYYPGTDGQGLLISVFPEIRQMFLAWFTYDTQRPPQDVVALLGEPGHRWLTAQGPYDGNSATLTIFVTEGGVLDAAEPPASTDPAGDGTMLIEFSDCTQGLVNYEITSLGISGEIPIQRIVPDNVALCEALASP